MVSDSELITAIEGFIQEEKNAKELYFAGVIDFLKWTTTIALASFLWIGANIPHFTKLLDSTTINQSINGSLPQTFRISSNIMSFISGTSLFFAFVFITLSLVFAILILFRIIGLKQWDWENLSGYRKFIELMKSMKSEDVNNDFIAEKIKEIQQTLAPADNYKQFTILVKLHVFSLVVGIILFYFGVLFAVTA